MTHNIKAGLDAVKTDGQLSQWIEFERRFLRRRLLRLRQIIGDRRGKPSVEGIVPMSNSAWWAGIKAGRFPAPVYLDGVRVPYWHADEIAELIESAKK